VMARVSIFLYQRPIERRRVQLHQEHRFINGRRVILGGTMKMRGFILCLAVCLSIGQSIEAVAEDTETVGVVLAVQGTVTMQPATMTPPMPLHPFDEIGPLAIFDSQGGSRC